MAQAQGISPSAGASRPAPLAGAPPQPDTAPTPSLPAFAPCTSDGIQIDGEVASCGQPPCAPWTEPCGPLGRFWVRGEYLLWWIKDTRVPPLVTASPPGSAGILGNPGPVVLFGGAPIDNEERSGGRFSAGFWFDCEQTIGIEGGYLFLGSRSVSFSAGTPTAGGNTIARPFFNVTTGAEDSELVSQPGRLTGTVATSLSSRLQGAELNGICNLCCGCSGRVDLLAGFRWLELDEGLGITEDLAVPAD